MVMEGGLEGQPPAVGAEALVVEPPVTDEPPQNCPLVEGNHLPGEQPLIEDQPGPTATDQWGEGGTPQQSNQGPLQATSRQDLKQQMVKGMMKVV